MDKGVWQTTVHRVTESDMTEQLTLPVLTQLWENYTYTRT